MPAFGRLTRKFTSPESYPTASPRRRKSSSSKHGLFEAVNISPRSDSLQTAASLNDQTALQPAQKYRSGMALKGHGFIRAAKLPNKSIGLQPLREDLCWQWNFRRRQRKPDSERPQRRGPQSITPSSPPQNSGSPPHPHTHPQPPRPHPSAVLDIAPHPAKLTPTPSSHRTICPPSPGP